jgi:hypothetical protein
MPTPAAGAEHHQNQCSAATAAHLEAQLADQLVGAEHGVRHRLVWASGRKRAVVCDAVALKQHWRRIHEEEQPEHLVQALDEDVLPHLGCDQVLVTAVRLRARSAKRAQGSATA